MKVKILPREGKILLRGSENIVPREVKSELSFFAYQPSQGERILASLVQREKKSDNYRISTVLVLYTNNASILTIGNKILIIGKKEQQAEDSPLTFLGVLIIKKNTYFFLLNIFLAVTETSWIHQYYIP